MLLDGSVTKDFVAAMLLNELLHYVTSLNVPLDHVARVVKVRGVPHWSFRNQRDELCQLPVDGTDVSSLSVSRRYAKLEIMKDLTPVLNGCGIVLSRSNNIISDLELLSLLNV
jgi:hypothetical protein